MGEPGWADNWTVNQGGLLMEIMETATRNVWLCHSSVTADRYRSLGLPDGFVTSGLGRAVADVAYFRRPPGADDPGPLEAMEVDGLPFAHVARAGAPEADIVGAMVLPVEKHHSMLYAAGRTIEVLDFGDGSIAFPAFAPARRSDTADDRPLPETWALRSVTLDADLVIEVPCPARVAILGDGSGFHGPLSPDLVA
jgi:hypothetical protein